MRVLEIIQAYPEIFDTNPNNTYDEEEAIRIIASMVHKGDTSQKNIIQIRQRHLAIQNLIQMGFLETAVEMAEDLIAMAQKAKQFNIVQELCHFLISHSLMIGNPKSVLLYKNLFDKIQSNIALEHETILLSGTAILNQNKVSAIPPAKLTVLLASIKKNMLMDPVWYHYYFFQFRALLCSKDELVKIYKQAIEYFQNLYFKHDYFSNFFLRKLILFYLENKTPEKAEKEITSVEIGSVFWYEIYLEYAQYLLSVEDLKAHDICLLTMNDSAFVSLPPELKEKWRTVYKKAVRLLLDS
ncbi:MAG: hypothetical protein AAGA77_17760 [Bacteroidota bacterium]